VGTLWKAQAAKVAERAMKVSTTAAGFLGAMGRVASSRITAQAKLAERAYRIRAVGSLARGPPRPLYEHSSTAEMS